MRKKGILLSKKPMVIIGIVVSIIIIIGGYFYYISERDSFRKEKHTELRAIVELKINQILKWRKERIANITVTSQSVLLKKAITQWITNKDNLILKEEILERLSLTQKEYVYEDILITNTHGELLLSIEENAAGIDSIIKQEGIKTAEKNKIIISDFFKCPIEEKEHLIISSPLYNDNEVFAVMVFIVNPNEYIYPLIQSWPTPSETAETLMLRKDGNSVLFINELRHRKNTSLELRIPLTEEEIPAVQAVSGYEGIFEGKDYRGEDVLVDIRKIPDTPWYMIAKVDQSEIYNMLRVKTFVIAGFVILLIFLLSIGLAFVYHYRQVDTYQDLYLKEKKLRESEAKFQSYIENSPTGIFIVNEEGHYHDCNRAAYDLLGYTREELLKMSIPEITPEENAEIGVQSFITLKEKGYIYVEVKLLRKDRTIVPVILEAVRLPDNKFIAYCTDITERMQAEEMVGISEKKFRTIFDKTTDGIVITDMETHKFSDANESMCKMIGYSLEELKTLGVADIHPKEEMPYILEQIEKQSKDASSPAVDLQVLRKNGNIFYASVLSTRMNLFGKNYMVAIFRDITERKKADAALKESEDKYRSLFENAVEGIYQSTPEGKFISANPALASMLGFKSPEETLKKITNIKTQLYVNSPQRDENVKLMEKEDTVNNYELQLYRQDKSKIWVSISSRAVRDSKGKMQFYEGIMEDITERKRAEEQIHRKSAVLSAINNVFKEAITCETLEEVAYTCINMAEELTGSTFGLIGEVNKEGLFDTITCGDLGWKICKIPETDAIVLTKNMLIRGIWGQAILKGKSQIVNDPDSHPEKVGIPKGHPQIKCFMGVPLIHESKVIGLIGLANKEGGYTSADKEAVESLSLTFVEALHRKRVENAIINSRKQLRNLSSHLQTIREEERGVISREIHDDLGQSLTALKMDMSWFNKHLHDGDDSGEKKIKGMIKLVDETIKSVQRISTELRPGLLDDLGFSSAVGWFMNEFEERSELKCQLDIKPDDIVLDEKLSIAMYRIFQESLTNVARHAKATKVNVNITLANSKFEMIVADNGIGIDETKLNDPKSLGLIGMQERVYPWKGTVEITGEKGKGTVVHVNVNPVK